MSSLFFPNIQKTDKNEGGTLKKEIQFFFAALPLK